MGEAAGNGWRASAYLKYIAYYVVCYVLYVIGYILYVVCYILYVVCYSLYVVRMLLQGRDIVGRRRGPPYIYIYKLHIYTYIGYSGEAAGSEQLALECLTEYCGTYIYKVHIYTDIYM